jgi:hypothetical protein
MNAYVVEVFTFSIMLQTCDCVVLSLHPSRNVQTQPRILSDRFNLLASINDAIANTGDARHLFAHCRSLRGMNELGICPASVKA